MAEPIHPLEYETRKPLEPWNPLETTLCLVAVAATWSVLLLFVVGHFKSIFAQHHAPLPRITMVVLNLANPTRGLGLLFVAFLWAVAICVPIFLALLYPSRTASRWVRWISVVFLLFTVLLFGIALGMPSLARP